MKLLCKTSLSPFRTKQKNKLRTYFKSFNFFLFLGKRYCGALEFSSHQERPWLPRPAGQPLLIMGVFHWVACAFLIIILRLSDTPEKRRTLDEVYWSHEKWWWSRFLAGSGISRGVPQNQSQWHDASVQSRGAGPGVLARALRHGVSLDPARPASRFSELTSSDLVHNSLGVSQDT